MKKIISINADDPILKSLKFRPYRNIVERHVETFAPPSNENQITELVTPWGEKLIVHAGDFIVNEINNPQDRWPVRADIFYETYKITRPGCCIKLGLVHLVPMVDLTGGDEDTQVIVHSLEGPTTVRAGDFFLALGSMGEIWSYPREKVNEVMVLADK